MEAVKKQDSMKVSKGKDLSDYVGLGVVLLGIAYLIKNYMTYSSYFNVDNVAMPIESLTFWKSTVSISSSNGSYIN